MSAHPEAAAGPMAPGATAVRVSPVLLGVFVALTVVGFAGLVAGIQSESAPHAWQAFLVNLLFFMGIAQGGVIVSSAFYLTQARWGGPGVYRLAESFYLFIPAGFILFWVLFFGRAQLWPWVTKPVARNPVWLNTPFFFAREGFALLLLTLLSMWFVRISRREDVRRWALSNEDINLPPAAIRRLAPVLALTYAAVFSLVAFDLVMSLVPQWKSTLFGAYFFAGAFWSAIATMAFIASVLRGRLGPGNLFTRSTVMHDLGKMVFAFSVFWVYLLFAQYIVIWYADIPAETFFLVVRGAIIGGATGYTPWMPLTWSVFALVFVIPFCVLMSARAKRTPAILGAVALAGFAGMWLERYVLVVPSLSPHEVPFDWIELLVTLGFLGLFGLCAIPGMKLTVAAACAPEALEGVQE